MIILERVKNILLRPGEEWPVIDKETTPPATLFTSYIIPLAAIGPIASVVGMSLIGISMPFGTGTFRVPFVSAILHGIVTFVLALVSVYVLALIVNALAPAFSGQKNAAQSLKVTAYSATAAWLAGIFSLIPMLAILSILGLYSLYLLYVGLPVLMKSPPDKALGYTAVVIVCALVLFFIFGYLSSALIMPQMDVTTMPGMPPGMR